MKQNIYYGRQLFEEAQIYYAKGNLKKSATLLKKAAEQGYAEAQDELSARYYMGSLVKKNPSKGFYWCMKAAEQGHFQAQVNLTTFYVLGIGVKKDIKKAIEWAKITSNSGDNTAFKNIMLALEQENTEEAFQCCLELAEYGLADAQKRIAEFYYEGNAVSRDVNKANYWMKKAVEKGDDKLLHNIAFAYEKGLGIEQSYEEAFKIVSELAEKGIAESQYSLGSYYNEGWGVAKNVPKAIYWWEKASENGSAAAQCSLGFFYQNGIGVKQDYEKAFEFYHKSIEQNYANAYYDLGCCYYRGLGIKEDEAYANFLFKKAAEQGHLNAQFNLGLNYEGGIGVKEDIDKAIYWYSKAADQGDKEAKERLVRLRQLKVAQTVINSDVESGKKAKSILDSLHNIGTKAQESPEEDNEEKDNKTERSIIEKEKDLVDAGVEAKRAGDYEKAIDFYKEAVRLSPTNGNSYYALGKVLYIGGHYEEAFRAYLLAYLHNAHCLTKNLFMHAGHAILDAENSKKQEYTILIKAYIASVQGKAPDKVFSNRKEAMQFMNKIDEYQKYANICVAKGEEEILRQAKIQSRI